MVRRLACGGQTANRTVSAGKKVSDTGGCCPHWRGAQTASSQLAKDIKETGRARINGINFDTESDVIKPESNAALETIVKLAKEKNDWKFTIEGHTDSTATPAYNQSLSEKRAVAVKTYLTAAGVACTRMAAQGLGATKPVADNSTAMGRAQSGGGAGEELAGFLAPQVLVGLTFRNFH